MNQFSPALTGDHVEFFADEHTEYGIHNGVTHTASTLPEGLKTIIREEIARDPAVARELQIMQPDPALQIGQFIRCRYSQFDGTPDIDAQGRMGAAEWSICANRGSCRAEGVVCKPVSLKNGELTRRETQVLQLIGLGLLDKEICAVLFIAPDTLRNHKDSLSRKAGVERKTALAVVAFQNGLTG